MTQFIEIKISSVVSKLGTRIKFLQYNSWRVMDSTFIIGANTVVSIPWMKTSDATNGLGMAVGMVFTLTMKSNELKIECDSLYRKC